MNEGPERRPADIIREAGVSIDIDDPRTTEQIAKTIQNTGSPALIGCEIIKSDEPVVAQLDTDTV